MNPINEKNISFRTDVNGLRAWAVLAVIFYHFNVEGFNGGFVGVDIFFVISGYLMTAIVIKGVEPNTFSYSRFIASRIVRIVPALIALLATLLVLGLFFITPNEYDRLAVHTIFSLNFISNFKFFFESGYFDSSSHDKFLLHTWSLAVEWQFYVIYPIIISTIWKVWPKRISVLIFITIIFFLSYILSIVSSSYDPTFAFFLLPARAWELIAGGIVYFLAAKLALSEKDSRLLEFIGFLLIFISVFVFNGQNKWPGWLAMIPVLGTAFVLIAARSDSIFTSNAFAQWIGNRSYSLYLWHWPICALQYYYEVQYQVAFTLLSLLATLSLGTLSYKFIERSSKTLLKAASTKKLFAIAFGLYIVTITICLIIHKFDGLPIRFSSAINSISNESLNVNPRRADCHVSTGDKSPLCIYGGKIPAAIVLGDSHADSVITAVAQAIVDPGKGVIQASYGACPIVLGAHNALSDADGCENFTKNILTYFGDIPSEVPIILITRNSLYVNGRPNDKFQPDQPLIFFTERQRYSDSRLVSEYQDALVATVCKLTSQRSVYLVRPIPEMPIDVPKTSRGLIFNQQPAVFVTEIDYHKKNDFVWRAQDIAREKCNAEILNPLPFLCKSGICSGFYNSRPVYFDDNHLSEYGNRLLTPMFTRIFDGTPH